jgi:hypothetical protein
VKLILSFVEAVSQWAKVGLSFDGLRANDPKHRDLCFVRRSGWADCTFVLADLGILGAHDADKDILSSEWLRGAAVADAIRFLYYGTDSKQQARRKAVYRRQWNDNIAYEMAQRLDGVGLIHAETLHRELTTALRDECKRWPLLFHDVDEQFVRDITDAGFGSVWEAVATVHPMRLLLDRGPRFSRVFYAFSEEAQVGLLHSPKRLSFTLYRYIPYLTRRWERTRERDWGASIALDLRDRESGVFVGVRDATEEVQTISDLFEITEAQYRLWLDKLLRDATSRRTEAVLPEVLRPEAELLELRRRRLDLLRQMEVPFEMFVDNAEPATIGSTVTLSLIGDNHLAVRLKRLEYSFVGDQIGLHIVAADSEGRRLEGTLRRCISEPPSEVVCVDITRLAAGFSAYGRFRITDPGSDTVVRSEESMLRELSYSLSSGQIDTPVLQAWRILDRVLGSYPLGRRSTANLWSGETRYVEAGEGVDADFERTTELGKDSSACDHGIHLLTGAPGTGKTRVAARLASDHLASASDDETPRRVLVVAASHFGIDNFLRTLLDVSAASLNVFRNVPRLRVDLLKNRRVIDASLHDRLTKTLERQKRLLPRPQPRPSDKLSVSAYAALVRSEIEAAEGIRADLREKPASVVIPSHEQWRELYGFKTASPLPVEIVTKTSYLRNRLEDLATLRDIEEESAAEETYAGEALYLQFGCDVIATTPDAFDRIPDMTYSLVVFEEASQLAALKILKVLTKIMRACSVEPMVLMSGDAQQLPPFVDSYSEAGESADPDIVAQIGNSPEAERVRDFRTKETPFERLCARNASISLEVQHRMHPDIATLINSLFYSGQRWTSTRTDVVGAVMWANTHGLRPRVLIEQNGTSRYNLEEREVIKDLVHDWIRPSQSVLVVSPYSAQVSKLMESIDRRISVRTIDGCQGIEADVVMVSFVSFRFSEGRDFVIDPRRMNVALSRARDLLYLVGDLDELRMSVERLPVGHAYKHLQGLAALFGEGGHFRNCVTPWPYESSSGIPR